MLLKIVNGQGIQILQLHAPCALFNCNINMYTLNEEGYSVFFQYNSKRGEIQKNIKNIDIL